MNVIKELSIKFNEDMEWDIIGTTPTTKDWENIQEYLEPVLTAVDNGIGYYEYGSITGHHVQWDVEVQEDGGALKLIVHVSNHELIDWTPEEIINEILDTQDYLLSSYSWRNDDRHVECELILECIKAEYSAKEKAVIAKVGYQMVS